MSVQSLLTSVTSSDVSKRFGFWYAEAMARPIAVERNGVARVVMLSAAEYQRLARLDHVALRPAELSNEDIRAFVTPTRLDTGNL